MPGTPVIGKTHRRQMLWLQERKRWRRRQIASQCHGRAIVQRIFEMAADSSSLRTIARTLNNEHVPSPRPRAGKQYATWCPTAIREMLRRDLYTLRPPGREWRVMEQPELRIIGKDLWKRVQSRLTFVATTFGHGKRKGLYYRAASSQYLLTGFLKCGSCGANLVIVTGRGNGGHPIYGCPQNFYRGACTNRLKERADWLEDRLLSELQRAVIQPEAVDYALQEFEGQLAASLAESSSQTSHMRKPSEQIQEGTPSAPHRTTLTP